MDGNKSHEDERNNHEAEYDAEYDATYDVGYDVVSETKGHKQKIFQLRKDLMAQKNKVINPNLTSTPMMNKMSILRHAYDAAKHRSTEILSSSELNYHLKIHGTNASRLYSALSTLLYSSISIHKTEELERYIKRSAAQIPTNLFDLNEWKEVLETAKEFRNVNTAAVHDKVADLQKKSGVFAFLALNPLQTTKAAVNKLKTDVTTAISMMHTDMINGKNLIIYVVTKLKEMCSATNLERLTQENKNLRTTYGSEYDKMRNFIDALVKKHKEDTERERKEVEANHQAYIDQFKKTLAEQESMIECQKLEIGREKKSCQDLMKDKEELMENKRELMKDKEELMKQHSNHVDKLKADALSDQSKEIQKVEYSLAMSNQAVIEKVKAEHVEAMNQATKLFSEELTAKTKDLKHSHSKIADLHTQLSKLKEDLLKLESELRKCKLDRDAVKKEVEDVRTNAGDQLAVLKVELARQSASNTKPNPDPALKPFVAAEKNLAIEVVRNVITEVGSSQSGSRTSSPCKISPRRSDSKQKEDQESIRILHEKCTELTARLASKDTELASLRLIIDTAKNTVTPLITPRSQIVISPRSELQAKSRAEAQMVALQAVKLGLDRMNQRQTYNTTERAVKKTRANLTQGQAATILQSIVRGFLGRCRVRRITTAAVAQAQGVLVAYPGTKQGESGWYTAHGLMFYFCLYKGEYVLLCGPITEEMYEFSKRELTNIGSVEGHVSELRYAFKLDRLAVHTIRLQIDSLMEDIRERDNTIGTFREDFTSYQDEIDSAIVHYNQQMNGEIAALKGRIKDYEAMLTNYERAAKQNDIEAVPSVVLEQISKGNSLKFIKATSIVRGFLGRRRVKKKLLHALSKKTGILVATGKTMQGKSGWYKTPAGQYYYFVLRDDEWIQVAGPLSESDFDLCCLQIRQNSESASKTGVLVRSNINLREADTVMMERGFVCMACDSNKLLIALPVDDVIRGSELYLREGGLLEDTYTGGDQKSFSSISEFEQESLVGIASQEKEEEEP